MRVPKTYPRPGEVLRGGESGAILLWAVVLAATVATLALAAQTRTSQAAETAARVAQQAYLERANDEALEYLAGALRAETIEVWELGFKKVPATMKGRLEKKSATKLVYVSCAVNSMSQGELVALHSGSSSRCSAPIETELEWLKSFTYIDPNRDGLLGKQTKPTRAALVMATTKAKGGLVAQKKASLNAFSDSCNLFDKNGNPTIVPIDLQGSGVGISGLISFSGNVPFASIAGGGRWVGNNYVIDDIRWYNDTKVPINYAPDTLAVRAAFLKGWDHQHAFFNRGTLTVYNAHKAAILGGCLYVYTQTSTTYISGCLHVDSLIRLADGSDKRLVELTPDDVLWNPVAKRGVAFRRYVKAPGDKDQTLIEITGAGLHLRVTANHPVMTADGPRRAEALTVGDRVLAQSGDYSIVKATKRVVAASDDVVNLELAADATDLEGHYLVADGHVVGDVVVQERLAEELAAAALDEKRVAQAREMRR